MRTDSVTLRERYGEWALIVGGSTGLGLAMAAEAARGGMNLALVARRESVLEQAKQELQQAYGVQIRTASADISAPDDAVRIVHDLTRDLEVGLFAYNAAVEEIGPFLEIPWERHLAEIMGNCVTPMRLSYEISESMVARKRGCILLVSSLSAIQGSVFTVGYGATKAFEWILAEGLWAELHGKGIDVVGVLLGATATPNLLQHGVQLIPMSPEEMEVEDPGQTLQNRLVNASPPPDAAAYLFAQLQHGPTVFSDPIDGRLVRKLFRLSRREAVMAMVANMESGQITVDG